MTTDPAASVQHRDTELLSGILVLARIDLAPASLSTPPLGPVRTGAALRRRRDGISVKRPQHPARGTTVTP
jgi:hypothetical protein